MTKWKVLQGMALVACAVVVGGAIGAGFVLGLAHLQMRYPTIG